MVAVMETTHNPGDMNTGGGGGGAGVANNINQ